MTTPMDQGEELSTLCEAFRETLAGRGQVVVVSGPVASGKTHLVQTFLGRTVGAHAVVLSAAAARAERSMPLSVIGQLFRAADLPPDSAQLVRRLLDDGAFGAMLGDPDGDATGQVSAPVLHGLCMALLDLCEGQPTVVVVDDFHYIDVPSLQCLSYLVRRLRSTRVMVVLNESVGPQPAHPLFESELMRLPYSRTLRLGTLRVEDVEKILARHLNADVAPRLAAQVHATSGGNPLLVHGLISDIRSAGPREPVRLVAGPGFTDAFITCLHRCEFSMLKVARGLAVLSGPAEPALLGRLLELEPESVARAIAALNVAGLLEDGAFRHPAARAGVLDGLIPEDRAIMHATTAELLHDGGAPATTVARQLLAAGGVDRPWVLPILYEAAEQSLADADADLDLALGCLRLAHQSATDDRQRALSRVRLASAEWRANPSMVLRHLTGLTDAVRGGLLTGRHALAPVEWLLWFGRVEEAAALLDRVGDSTNPADAQADESLGSTRLWLHGLYPQARAEPADHPEPAAIEAGTAPVAPTPQGAWLLSAVMTGGPNAMAVAAAEQVLHESPLNERTLGPIGIALAALIYGDRLATAAQWCTPLLQEATKRRAPTWHAVLSALRAEIALRQGDLPAAEHHARTALSLISRKGWGVAVGAPLSTLVQALTAMGRYEDAMDQLRVPMPDTLFQTPLGLQYLRARGRYSLATGQPAAALSSFQACGELMTRWNLKVPAFVPWWSDSAQACVQLGRTAEARRLVKEQLALLGPAHVRTRGISLRALAATSDVKRRPALLRQALAALQLCGDRLELSLTLGDLSQAYYSLGEFSKARSMLRQAQNLTRLCGAKPLDDVVSKMDNVNGHPNRGDDAGGIAILSDAERRVAALAGQGHTNRQIADELFVTVSTVEQHLTRVYRKLKVDCREKLPPLGLQWSAPAPVGGGSGRPGPREARQSGRD